MGEGAAMVFLIIANSVSEFELRVLCLNQKARKTEEKPEVGHVAAGIRYKKEKTI